LLENYDEAAVARGCRYGNSVMQNVKGGTHDHVIGWTIFYDSIESFNQKPCDWYFNSIFQLSFPDLGREMTQCNPKASCLVLSSIF
jgi:hypothetical protein